MLNRVYMKAKLVENVIEELIGDGGSNQTQFRDHSIFVETFHNGRENGFTFHVTGKDGYAYVYVAENRNSDAIAVTPSSKGEWAMIDDDYSNREFFGPYDYHKAAKRVLEMLGQALL